MKKILLIILAGLLITVAILFIRPSKSLDKNLVLAEELMSDRPDSALKILEKLKLENFSGENKALYALLMTQAQFKNYKPVESDSLIKIAYEYYVPSNDSLRKAQTYLYEGRVDEIMKKDKEVLKNYQKASIAASSTNNHKLLALIYSRWGIFLRKQNLYDDALNKQIKALKYTENIKDTLDQIFILKEIGSIYSFNQKFDKALFHYMNALKLAELIDNKSRISGICNSIGLLYKSLGNYNLSINYVNKSISLLSDSSLLYPRYSLKGSLFSLKQQYDSARYYLNLGKRDNDLTSNATYYSLMSELEEKQENFKDALLYSNSYIKCIYKIIDTDRESAIAELQKKYDYSLVKSENVQLELEKKSRNIFILVVLIIAIVVIWYVSYRYNKVRREKDEIIREGNEQLKQMADALIEWEMKLKEVKLKSKAELDAFVKWVLSKNEAIKKIERLAKMEISEVIAHKEELKLTPSEIENLKEVVDICFNNFSTRLLQNFSGISEENIQYCCLLRMKVPASSIAVLLGVSDGALVKRKYRFKKEMKVVIEGFSSLEEFLLNF